MKKWITKILGLLACAIGYHNFESKTLSEYNAKNFIESEHYLECVKCKTKTGRSTLITFRL